jgi:signal transduction histidine kinase
MNVSTRWESRGPDGFLEEASERAETHRPTLRVVTAARVHDARGRASVEEVMRAVARRVEGRAEAAQVRLIVNCGLGAVAGDLSAIVEAVVDLVLNAMEATPSGGAVFLATRLGSDGCQWWTIWDTAPRVSPARTGRPGPAFASSRCGGCGVGFAKVRRTVESHGGTVRVHLPGSGTVVAIRLPAAS